MRGKKGERERERESGRRGGAIERERGEEGLESGRQGVKEREREREREGGGGDGGKPRRHGQTKCKSIKNK